MDRCRWMERTQGSATRQISIIVDRYSDQGNSRVEEMSSHHISTKRMKLEKSSSFVNPFDLSIDITEEGSDVGDDSDDEDFEPSLNFTLRWQRSYNKKTARWSVQPAKADKSYSYVPRLLRVIICMRLQDNEGMN